MTTRRLHGFTAIALVISVSGCGHFIKQPEDVYSADQRHPIVVDADTATLALPVTSGMTQLPPTAVGEIKAFVASYNVRGHGPMTIGVPVGAANEAGAKRIAKEVERVVADSGMTPGTFVVQPYNVSADESAPPVTLSFTRYIASASPCGDWSKNYAHSNKNMPVPDFGCATQNNLAAMVEDPHDLIEPRAMGPSDAERRATVFDKYRKGESTATQRTEQERGNVSEVGP